MTDDRRIKRRAYRQTATQTRDTLKRERNNTNEARERERERERAEGQMEGRWTAGTQIQTGRESEAVPKTKDTERPR